MSCSIQSSKVSTFQNSKVPSFQDSKVRKFQVPKIPKFQNSKIPRFQDSAVSRSLNFKVIIFQIPNVQEYRNTHFPKLATHEILRYPKVIYFKMIWYFFHFQSSLVYPYLQMVQGFKKHEHRFFRDFKLSKLDLTGAR